MAQNKFMTKVVVSIVSMLLFIWQPILAKKAKAEPWPDGTSIHAWFSDTTAVQADKLGEAYLITRYGIFPDGTIHTTQLQALIDKIATEGGGRLVIPSGVFLSGGLHFRQGVHLQLMEGAVLMGSDNITDYPIGKTRIEGETCTYFGALINVENVDGFTILGPGTIDGNGQRYHQAFWLRRTWNPQCTNKDEQRPRLIYINKSKNVRIENVRLQNSAFWTCHLHECERVRIQGVYFYSLAEPDSHKGPSTDAIDLDVVEDILIRRCYMEVNDDAIAMKGGKGPWADNRQRYPENGDNRNVLIEDCNFGYCHACLTLGSESIFNHNILMRRIRVKHAERLLWLKMRPDTPQRYEYVTVEDVVGDVNYFLYIHPWTQFYDLKDREDIPRSYADHITLRRCNISFARKDIEIIYDPKQYEITNLEYSENLLRFRER